MTAVTDFCRLLRRFIESYVYLGMSLGLVAAMLVGFLIGVESIVGKFLFLAVGVCAGIAIGAYLDKRRGASRDEPTEGGR